MSYSFRVLREEVAQEDLLKHQTHERIADAILTLFDNESKSLTIGIEGGWGSGKSTVVNLFCNKLRYKSPDTLVFNFDTWAHEGDPLRRIFLEKYLDQAETHPKKPLKEHQSKWLEDIRAQITGRKKTVDVEIKSHTTRYAKWIAIASLFIPAGAALFTKVDYSRLNLFNWNSNPYWTFIFATLFTFAPLITSGVWWLGGKWRWKHCLDDEGKPRDFSLVNTDSTQKYTQDITEDGERTSVEFERFFSDISEYLQTQSICDRVVIIIDNLDRIDSSEALKMWSTLQTFFQHRSTPSSGEAWRDKVWFIVPHDRKGLSAIWKASGNQEPEPERSPESDTRATHDQTTHVAHSFLNKCFQVRFEVPQPIMSAWHEFFTKQLEDSLVDWPTEKKQEISRAYQACNCRLGSSPNPREIRNFINQVGLIGMTWGKEVPAESIALYCHLRHKYGEASLRELLLQGTIPDGIPIQGDRNEVVAELAGLLFGVEKDVGVELLLKNPIADALASGEPEEIKSLIDRFGEAFWIVWEALKDDLRPGGNSTTEEYLLSFILAISPLSRAENRFASSIRSIEAYARRPEREWKLNELDYAEALDEFSRSCSKAFLEWLQRALRVQAKKILDKFAEENESLTEAGVEQIARIAKTLESRGLEPTALVHPKLGAETWSKWTSLWKSDSPVPRFIKPAKGMITQVSSVIQANANPVSEEVFANLKSAYAINSECDEWPEASRLFRGWLQTADRKPTDEAYEICCQLIISDDSSVSNPIKAAVKHQHFWAHQSCSALAGSRCFTIPLLASQALGENLQANPHAGASTKEFWSTKEIGENHEKVYTILSRRGAAGSLWHLAEDKTNAASIGLLHRNRQDEKQWNVHDPIKVFNREIDVEKEHEIGELMETYLERYGANEILEFIGDAHVHAHALFNLTSFERTESTTLAESICDTNRMTKEEWLKSFEDGDRLVDIALWSDIKFERYRFSEAFAEYACSVIGGPDAATNTIWSRFDTFLESIVDRENHEKQILDAYFTKASGDFDETLFGALAQMEITSYSPSNPTAFMETVCGWMDSGHVEPLEWMVSIARVEAKPTESLRGRLVDAAKDENDSCHKIVSELSALFDVEIPSDSEASEE